MIWGPPRLRLEPRPLELALRDPFDLDLAAAFQASVWLLSACTVLLFVAARGKMGLPSIPPIIYKSSLRFYLLYGLLALASAAYSVSPLYTLFFAGKILVSVFAVGLLVKRADMAATVPHFLKLFFFAQIFQWLLTVFTFLMNPELVGSELTDIGYRLSGGLFEDYGTPAALAGIYFLCEALYLRRGLVRVIFMGLYGLTWIFVILSRTRSTILGAVCVLFCALVLHSSMRVRIMTVISGTLLLMAISLSTFSNMIVSYGLRGQNAEALLSLTGRVHAFRFLMTEWQSAPWLGHGYAAGSRQLLMAFVDQTGLGIGAAHDAASKVLTDLGLVGCMLLTFILVAAWREVVRLLRSVKHRKDVRPLAVHVWCLLTFFTLISVVSSGIADAGFPFLIISASVALANNRLRHCPS